MTRLEALSPSLSVDLQRSSSAKQRAAAIAASAFAIARSKIEHPLVEMALEKVRALSALTPKERADLHALAAQLDEDYFALQQAADAGRASTEDCMQLFGQARSVAALAFAGGEDALQSSREAVYEAAAITDDKEELYALIKSTLH